MNKKIFTVILSLILVVTMMPLSVFANTNSAKATNSKELKYYINEYAGNHHSGYKRIKSIKSRQTSNLGVSYDENARVINAGSSALTLGAMVASPVESQVDLKSGDTVNGKTVKTIVRLYIKGGAATPAPPIGPALGQHGVNIEKFCQQFNAETKDRAGQIIKTTVIVYTDKSFSIAYK